MAYEDNYPLQKKPWKVWMSSAPNPTAVLATARQLLNGTSLGHNILIYNGNLYQNGVWQGTSFQEFYRYMIDIAPAIFDKRSKSGTLNLDVVNLSQKDVLNESALSINLYNKDAALYPENIKTQWGVNGAWQDYFRKTSNLAADVMGVSYSSGDGFSCEATSQDITYANIESDIIVYQKDDVFSNTMAFEDGKQAFTKLKLNQKKSQVMRLIVGAILLNSTDPVTLLSRVTEGNLVKIFTEFMAQDAKTGILDNIYFWVKAPFCADYIDPDDFNQNLNQDADVAHRNLLLASHYVDLIRNNYNRFNEGYTFEKAEQEEEVSTYAEFLEKFSRPYVPTNTPLKDMISDDLAAIEGIDYNFNKHQNVFDAAKKILDRSFVYQGTEQTALNYESVLGSVLTLPVRNVDNDLTRITPFNFYDPDSREKAEWYSELGRLPTLIGKEGNITTDGRIMSPTIDELWYIVKKIISGEPISTAVPGNIAIPHNDVAKDTTLTEAVMAQYQWDIEKNGIRKAIDPIDFKYTEDSDKRVVGIDVKEYVVQPENVNHRVYRLLDTVSKRLNKFYYENVDVTEEFAENEETHEVTYSGNSRDITRVGDYIIGTSKMDLASSNSNEYGPRQEAPLSLRELEAAILGNKYNLENNFVFASKTYSVTGKFGKQLSDESGTYSGGSLYQLHRDYNADVENPNTYFKLEGDNTPEKGSDITAGDLNGGREVNDEGPSIIPVYILDENNKRTEAINTGRLPIMVAHYGTSTLLSQRQGKYTGADVYLAADGTWRYKAEHMRMPILRSRY